MKKTNFRKLGFLILICTLLFSNSVNCYAIEAAAGAGDETAEALSEDVKVSSRLWELFFGDKKTETGAKETRMVALGGNVFGIKMNTAYPVVVDAKDNSLLRHGDAIVAIGDREVKCNKDVESILGGCGGEVLSLRVLP